MVGEFHMEEKLSSNTWLAPVTWGNVFPKSRREWSQGPGLFMVILS